MYFVCWQSRFTDASGRIGPTRKELAEDIAAAHNLRFGDILHWVEPGSTEDLDLAPALADHSD